MEITPAPRVRFSRTCLHCQKDAKATRSSKGFLITLCCGAGMKMVNRKTGRSFVISEGVHAPLELSA